MTPLQVLISGAGIAGPALAHWLTRYGHTVTIVERSPAPRRGGQAVDLRGAGRLVIERMGLLDAARERSLHQRGLAWVGADGRHLGEIPADAFGGEGFVSEIEILRGDLVDLLLDATTGGVEYRWGDSITALAQDAAGVDVTFEKAAPQRFDVVVGADGLHSVVRALAFEPAVRPLGLYWAWFTAAAEPSLDGWFAMHHLAGGRVATLRPGRLASDTKAALSFRSGPVLVDGRDLARCDPEQQKAEVARRFADGGWRVPALLDAMAATPDFALESVGQVHLPRWSTGRVVLLGDAGYCPTPLTGLGTSLALVGAYVLAGELASGPAGGDGVLAALARYEEVLRPYVTTAQKLPPGAVGGFAPRSALVIRALPVWFALMTRWPVRRILEAQFAKAGDVTVPDYPRVQGASSRT